MPFQKGKIKTGGKVKGTLNRSTKEAKELLETIMFGQMDNVAEMFEALKNDPAKYMDAYSKMFGYVMPKKTDITSGDEKILAHLPNINITTKNARND